MHTDSYLNIVRHIQLSGGRWEKRRYVYTEQAGDWHVHGAQFGWRHAKKESNACHLMALTKIRICLCMFLVETTCIESGIVITYSCVLI